MKILTYIKDGQVCKDNQELCEYALNKMFAECKNDRLENNYSIDTMRLDQMKLYTFVFDNNNNPIQGSGCQIMADNVVRVFSRYYAFKDFRTDSTSLYDKVDNFLELKYCLPRLMNYPLVIWSRDKSPGFFKRIKEHRKDIFADWNLYNEKIELKWRNNFQYIFYTGNADYIKEIIKH